MGYISVKLTDIEVNSHFKILIKNGSALYPITGDTWTDYGMLLDPVIELYTGNTVNDIILSGNTYDFQYNETYWIKIQDYNNNEKYIIKNIKINDEIAYRSVIPI